MNIYDLEHLKCCVESQKPVGGFFSISPGSILSFQVNDDAFSVKLGGVSLIETKLTNIPSEGISLPITTVPNVVTSTFTKTNPIGEVISKRYSAFGGWKEGNTSISFSSTSSFSAV